MKSKFLIKFGLANHYFWISYKKQNLGKFGGYYLISQEKQFISQNDAVRTEFQTVEQQYYH